MASRAALWLLTMTRSTSAVLSWRSIVTTGMLRSVSTSMWVCVVDAGDSSTPAMCFGRRHLEVAELLLQVLVRVGQDDRVAGRARDILHSAHHRGEERVGDIGDDHSDDRRRPPAQVPGLRVRVVSELCHRGESDLAGRPRPPRRRSGPGTPWPVRPPPPARRPESLPAPSTGSPRCPGHCPPLSCRGLTHRASAFYFPLKSISTKIIEKVDTKNASQQVLELV